MDKYKSIYKHYETCLIKHGDNHFGVDWPNYEDLITRYKIMLNIVNYFDKNIKYSVLDFGAGCGGLYDFIKSNKLKSLTEREGLKWLKKNGIS